MIIKSNHNVFSKPACVGDDLSEASALWATVSLESGAL